MFFIRFSFKIEEGGPGARKGSLPSPPNTRYQAPPRPPYLLTDDEDEDSSDDSSSDDSDDNDDSDDSDGWVDVFDVSACAPLELQKAPRRVGCLPVRTGLYSE